MLQTLIKISPIHLLEQFSKDNFDGVIKVEHESVKWFICFQAGKLIYATHSLDPFERLDLHLRRLSQKNPALTSQIRNRVRFDFELELSEDIIPSQEYQAICWLITEKYLNQREADLLIGKLILEALESLLLLPEVEYTLIKRPQKMPFFVALKAATIIEISLQKNQEWEALKPYVYSPYQRAYFFSQSHKNIEISPEKKQYLSKMLRGFSFRQLAVLVNQDELKLAQSLIPLIQKGYISLSEPHNPFAKLPNLARYPLENHSQITTQKSQLDSLVIEPILPDFSVKQVINKQYKVACVDDSPTVLNQIQEFLGESNLSIFTINDSLQALREILQIKPDLVLLDVGMPRVDGYQLCRLIRNHSLFKHIPIIMVTGNISIPDREKAKTAGATDYMTKPFSQSELTKMVFRYLTS